MLHHIVNAIRAIYGSSTAASLLQSDQFLRDARALDESSEAPAFVDVNTDTRAELFSALQVCLNAASAAVDRVYRMARIRRMSVMLRRLRRFAVSECVLLCFRTTR